MFNQDLTYFSHAFQEILLAFLDSFERKRLCTATPVFGSVFPPGLRGTSKCVPSSASPSPRHPVGEELEDGDIATRRRPRRYRPRRSAVCGIGPSGRRNEGLWDVLSFLGVINKDTAARGGKRH